MCRDTPRRGRDTHILFHKLRGIRGCLVPAPSLILLTGGSTLVASSCWVGGWRKQVVASSLEPKWQQPVTPPPPILVAFIASGRMSTSCYGLVLALVLILVPILVLVPLPVLVLVLVLATAFQQPAATTHYRPLLFCFAFACDSELSKVMPRSGVKSSTEVKS